MKKILIIYATYGSGHKAIAKYIKNYFTYQNPNLDIKMIDMIDYSNKMGMISKKVSEKLMLRFPHVWSIIFKGSDNKTASRITNRVSLNWFSKESLQKDIKEYNPDLIISTHFYGSAFVALLNKKKIINSKLITIITDYEAHNVWLEHYKKGEYIIAPCKEEKRLLSKKIPAKYIMDYGIPIFPKSNNKLKQQEMIKSLGLNPNLLTCLCFLGGGSGSVATIPYVKLLLKANANINYIFVCGSNDKVYNKMKTMIKKYNPSNYKLYGFVNNVPDLLTACDFVVTKPGGAQTTECLYFNKPMLFIKSNGGQENQNILFFTKRKYGKFFKTPKKLYKYFYKFDKNKSDIKKMQTNISRIDNTKAMKKLYNLTETILYDVKAK